MKQLKTFYFFAMLNVKGEPVTKAMRFKYFLVSTSGNADSYEAEMKVNEKIKKLPLCFCYKIRQPMKWQT